MTRTCYPERGSASATWRHPAVIPPLAGRASLAASARTRPPGRVRQFASGGPHKTTTMGRGSIR